MFKKTTTFLILLTILVMSLAACSGSEASPSDSPVEAESSAVQTESLAEETAVAQTDSATVSEAATTSLTYSIVDTNQGFCFDGFERLDECPAEGEAFYGQDAQYTGITPSYTDNGDPSTGSGQAGAITDNVTGLV